VHQLDIKVLDCRLNLQKDHVAEIILFSKIQHYF